MKKRKHIYYTDSITGETKDAINATIPNEIWDGATITKAQTLLSLRFDDAPFVNTTIQEMQDLLIDKFRDDPQQVDRAITQHFKKRKL